MFVDQIKQSDWSLVSSNKHINHGSVRPELDRSKISKQAYSHCSNIIEICPFAPFSPQCMTGAMGAVVSYIAVIAGGKCSMISGIYIALVYVWLAFVWGKML